MNNHNPIEDISPLTPLHQGMMFHILYALDSRAYFHQYLSRSRAIWISRHLKGSGSKWWIGIRSCAALSNGKSWTSPFRLCGGE
jgi:hypothetical protein